MTMFFMTVFFMALATSPAMPVTMLGMVGVCPVSLFMAVADRHLVVPAPVA